MTPKNKERPFGDRVSMHRRTWTLAGLLVAALALAPAASAEEHEIPENPCNGLIDTNCEYMSTSGYSAGNWIGCGLYVEGSCIYGGGLPVPK